MEFHMVYGIEYNIWNSICYNIWNFYTYAAIYIAIYIHLQILDVKILQIRWISTNLWNVLQICRNPTHL